MNAPVNTVRGDLIRPFARKDAEAVSLLFHALMHHARDAAPRRLAAYLGSHFIDGPFADPEIPSLVYVSDEEEVEGFVGVVVQPMVYRQKTIRAAILGTLMVKGHDRAPTIGARLLRKAVSGPQDVTLSETAGEASLAMWRQLHGTVLDRYSYDYFRVLRPVSFAIALMARRVPWLAYATPVAQLLDRLAPRDGSRLGWTGLPGEFRTHGGVYARRVSVSDFARLTEVLLSADAVRPVWPDGCLPALIAEAMDKPEYGAPHLCEVVTRAGHPIGGFLLHFAPSALAQVLDVLHAPGQAGPVFDAMLCYARDLGACGVRGRITPSLFDALVSRKTPLAHAGASVIHGKDTALVAAFAEGRAHFNGLVGESWTRIIGGTFN
ncbi:hypothetical protein NO932_07850 [Pelagibacterium sp. 26DY04]|uniref:hypothetical protein n=1 Tax=Pelagibacterium sp. 26DY04 TaxID=2967130 RepID=UPI0028166D86|nr:hypothetical protein [Pelagibacterium sp. 26DY04]WMT88514.1 hypothetical protein NO932_07850 [Pelagibacterium sp. 26DY04]